MFRRWWLETVRLLPDDSEVDSEKGSEMFYKDKALLSCGNGIRIATQFRDLTVEVLWWSMFTMFYFRCWQHFSCVKKTMLCSMVLAKVWFFFGCKVLMVSGRKLAFAGSEGDHWMLPSSTIINYATFHHNCEDIPSGSHLIQGTGAACKLRPSQKPTSPTLLHPRHPLARFSVCLFFPSASIDGPLVVCWCGGAETPGPYWLRGGWWRRRDPETENPRAAPHLPPPRPLDLPTDQMQPPGPPASTTPNM